MDTDAKRVLAGGERERLRQAVLARGFDRVGFAEARPVQGAARLREWLRRGFAGDMAWLERTVAKREDPGLVLPGVRTVIVVALHYPPPIAGRSGSAGISAYARGDDYHDVMTPRLKTVCEDITRLHAVACRYYVDTGPVLEREWSRLAGVGWIGKNTCSIDPSAGSYFFLGVVLTTLSVEPDLPSVDHCGSCRRCIDACPTGALVAPYELDARRCISYLTIEHRGEISGSLARSSGNLVFGCDICQEVCPYNRGPISPGDAALAPRPENVAPPLGDLARLEATEFRARFRRSPVLRARPEGFLRNVIVALGNDRSAGADAVLDAVSRRSDVQASPLLTATLAIALQRRREDSPPASRPIS